MDIVTVRNLDPEVKGRLREQAARHGRSMEAEIRELLRAAVMAHDPPADLVSSARRRFADAAMDVELPDRAGQMQRAVDLGR